MDSEKELVYKKDLRKEYIKARNLLSGEEVRGSSEIIAEKLLSLEVYRRAGAIFIYIDIANEVITKDIILFSLEQGKTVAVPVAQKNKDMFFVRILDMDNLVESYFKTKIPVYGEGDIVKSDADTLIVVPGVVFDKKNRRLGYGGGYYDRYLSENNYFKAVGLAFDFQVIDELEIEEHDICLDMVLTDSREEKNSEE